MQGHTTDGWGVYWRTGRWALGYIISKRLPLRIIGGFGLSYHSQSSLAHIELQLRLGSIYGGGRECWPIAFVCICVSVLVMACHTSRVHPPPAG